MFNGGGEIVLMRLQKLFDNNLETQLIKSCDIVFLKIGREIFHVLGGIFEKKVPNTQLMMIEIQFRDKYYFNFQLQMFDLLCSKCVALN